MEWVFTALTAGFSCWFIVLLLDFNRPARALRDKVSRQEARMVELRERLNKAEEESETFAAQVQDLEFQCQSLEDRRQDLLDRANRKRFVLVEAGTFVMGSRYEDSPRTERPAHFSVKNMVPSGRKDMSQGFSSPVMNSVVSIFGTFMRSPWPSACAVVPAAIRTSADADAVKAVPI